MCTENKLVFNGSEPIQEQESSRLSKILTLDTFDDLTDSIILNGAHMGQGRKEIYGRTAWLQQSDWNRLYIPVARSRSIGKLQVDVYVPSGSIVSMCPFGERQDISNAFCVSLSQSEG